MFSMQCRKNIAVGDNRKRMNIANLIYIYIYIVKDKGIYNKGIYIYIYVPLLYLTRITENKNDSISNIAAWLYF